MLRRPCVRDAALAAGLLTACVVVNAPQRILAMAAPAEVWVWWAGSGLAVTGLALRGRAPLTMLLLVTLGAGAHLVQGVPLMLIDLAVPVLLHSVADRHLKAVSLAVLSGLLVGLLGWVTGSAVDATGPTVVSELRSGARMVVEPGSISTPTTQSSLPPPGLAVLPMGATADMISGIPLLASALLAAWATGSASRTQRAYLAQSQARAEDLERQRDQQAALAVAAERSRMSRELHDVVAHGLAVMVIQAQGGCAALARRPGQTRAALEAIVRTGRESLADMRRVLAGAGEPGGGWHPQRGLGDLPALLAEVRGAGTPVGLRIEGSPVPLPAPVDLSAYRIVQEALTNTMRHGGDGATAQVLLSYPAQAGPDAAIGIQVLDDGCGPGPAAGAGHGLRGMQERARLLGGRLDAGPADPVPGFTVRAVLPLAGDRS